jgi:hypothetical protein
MVYVPIALRLPQIPGKRSSSGQFAIAPGQQRLASQIFTQQAVHDQLGQVVRLLRDLGSEIKAVGELVNAMA